MTINRILGGPSLRGFPGHTLTCGYRSVLGPLDGHRGSPLSPSLLRPFFFLHFLGFEPVKEMFEANFRRGKEENAQLCVYVNGNTYNLLLNL